MYRSKSTAARGGNRSSGILNALHATSIVDPRANLPAEILVAILDYLPVADQIRFARASWRFQEMVYDDTRWVARLKAMGCWNELEARQRFEEMARKRKEAAMRAKAGAAGEAKTNGTRQASATLFDVAEEEEESKKRAASGLQDGFQTMTIGTTSAPVRNASDDPSKYLDVFKNVKSIRGGARQEYGKIYGALAPFYYDLITAQTHADPIVFEAFRDPESQAQMLANLKRFAKSDWAEASLDRDEKIQHMMSIFESAVLREFEQGYEFWDVDGRMRRYANVLHILDGSRSGIELFIHKHPIFEDKTLMVSPVNCMSRENPDEISLEPSQQFLDLILAKLNDQTPILERIFPQPSIAFWALADKIRDDIIMEYTTPLFDEAHERSIAAYLKAVSGVFEQTLQFFQSLQLPNDSELDLKEKAKELALSVFEPHVDLYLQEELDFFTKQAESEVDAWEKKLSEQDSSLESFYMANFNRSADKKDFLSSFKKVVMMPVTVLPNIGSTFANNSSSSKPTAVTANGSSVGTPQPSRPQTPGFGGLDGKTGLPEDAPKDELAAKAALMATKLEGIKSLFSIEVALNLVHSAKTSLGRAAVFIQLGGQVGEEAREQCANIFVVLLRILGQGHVKGGFQRAVESLSHYNPREASSHEKQGVAPLVMFIELVNVGDLISQMVDVFYEQQLAAPKIADKNDFLDPAGLAKKKFEQMLDENVAAGLNKGIDALMDEVEYLQATMQLPTDYNPGYDASESSTGILGSGAPNPFASAAAPAPQAASGSFNIGPTPTAQRIVELVSSHTKMLTGTTEKSMLDVFNAEVGLRLFTAICKHLKRQRISIDGAVPLIADMTIYFEYVRSLRNPDILPYFRALRELSQIYLIDPSHAKDMATVIADGDRFSGVFRAEEVYEYAQRRADWYQVRRSVERAMYGLECSVM